jgi:hypothetical protein
MTKLTAADWDGMTDEDLRHGLAIVLITVTDPRCEADVVDDMMALGQDIRDELARRIAARKVTS